MTVSDVPWWGVISSAAAPVLLVGGWTVAAERQPPSFDPVSDTVSELMAVDATDRWVMTTAFLAVGICYIITGTALRPARLAGRLILITGAVAGMLVAANPQPAVGGGSVPHAIWAALGFAGLAAWPAGAWRRGSSAPWGLRPGFCFGAVAIQLILLTWFAAEIATGAGQAGLAERVVGVDQVLCPLTVVLSCRLSRMSGSHTPKPRRYPESARFLGPSNLLPRSHEQTRRVHVLQLIEGELKLCLRPSRREEGKRLLSVSRRKRRDGTTEGGWTGPGSIPDWPPIGCGVIWFVADCIGNQDRWHRFPVLLAITMPVTAWWLA